MVEASSDAAATFRDNLLRIEKMEAKQKETEARSLAERKAGMHKLASEFQAAVGNIINTVSTASTQLESAAGTLTIVHDACGQPLQPILCCTRCQKPLARTEIRFDLGS